MLLCRSVSVATLALLAAISVVAAEPDQLKLEVAPEFLRGGMWIQVWNRITPPEDRWIDGGIVTIPLQRQDGARADSVRVIAAGRGCQLVVLQITAPQTGANPQRIECRKLRMLPLRGSIVGVSRPAGMSIQIFYVAPWSHAFMHILDGMVFQARVAEATVDANGRFELEIPDFASDPVHVKYNGESYAGSAEISIVGTYDGRTVTIVPRMAIQPEYPDSIFLVQ